MSRNDYGPQFNAGRRAGMMTGCGLSAGLLALLILVGWLTDDVTSYRFVREYHPDGAPRVEGLLSGDGPIGMWTYRHENGRIASQGNYGSRAASGGWSYWYDDGMPRAVGCFEHGSFHGEWVFFDRDGKKNAAATFERGRPVAWRRYSKDGSSELQPLPMFPDEPQFLETFKRRAPTATGD